jgi:hypothetical protein
MQIELNAPGKFKIKSFPFGPNKVAAYQGF